jgi:hypothetical protein
LTVDTSSTTERLALRGTGFVVSNKVAAAIQDGVATELADAVMAALRSRYKSLNKEDVCILADLYTNTPSAAMMMTEAVAVPEGPGTLAG